MPLAPDSQFLIADTPLRAADAVAALIVLDDGRYLLQQRDELPQIWYPGHWGLFGGAIEDHEETEAALRRELQEELNLDLPPDAFEPFARFDFDLSHFGQGKVHRTFFKLTLAQSRLGELRLSEGAAFGAFTAAEILGGQLPVTPYDSFALWLDIGRSRLAG
ncbi:Nudix hydrolase domain-containing protein [uncultured Gammaproteobacteria bacterium]